MERRKSDPIRRTHKSSRGIKGSLLNVETYLHRGLVGIRNVPPSRIDPVSSSLGVVDHVTDRT